MGSYSIKDVSLVNIIDRAEKDLQELKGRQFVGRRVLATKLSTAQGRVISVDYYGVPASAGVVGSAIYRKVTFTALNQKNPYGRLIIKLFNPDGSPIVNVGYGGDFPKVFYFNTIVGYVDDGKLSWNVDIRGPANPKFYAEFSVAATDEGTVDSAPTVAGG